MAGTKYLRRLYIGKESTDSAAWGTPVATTAQLFLDGVIERDDTVMFPEYPTGNFGLSNISYLPKKSSQIALSGEATFEQLPYIFAGGVYGATDTPTTDTGTGTGYIWTFQMPTTSIPAIQTYTIEGGDNEQGELFNFGFISEFTLSGASGEAWTLEATMMGRQSTDMTLAATSDRTIPTVEPILFGNTKLYIDLASTDFGTTQKTLTMLGATVTVKTGWMPKYSADGRLDYSFIQLGLSEVTAEIVFEHNANATAQKANWLAQTELLMRIIATGNTLTSAGAYTVKTLIIDMVGKWESFSGLDDQDGNDVVTGTFRSRFSNTTTATSTQFTKFLVVNEVALLP